MQFWKLGGICLLLLGLLQPMVVIADPPDKITLLSALANSIHPDDFALIEANLQHFSTEQLLEIQRFLLDLQAFANLESFDISAYHNWDELNYTRPVSVTLLGILARRDLFLDPARQLNNRALTNMSPEALAALAFSQVYVEEKWDREVPWDGDANTTFNWVHPDLLTAPNLMLSFGGDYLYRMRVEAWWVTHWSLPFEVAGRFGIGKGADMDAALRDMRPPNANAPRLAGYAYPLGNQLFLQTAETAYWYADYLTYGAQRYGDFEPQPVDTQINFPAGNAELLAAPFPTTDTSHMQTYLAKNPELLQYPGLWGLFNAPFGAALRRELLHPETAAFWNVMRFLHAAARQREGGASPEHPENGQPAIFALQYHRRTASPVGRDSADISAFALLTTVYSDSLLLDFTNWDMANERLLLIPADEARTDGVHRQVSERNKAIQVIEQMGDETIYPNSTHVSGSRGLGLHLTTQYDNPQQGDFLPYTREEAYALVMALITEAHEHQIEASHFTLCHSPLLKSGYEAYASRANAPAWNELVSDLCA